MDARKTYAFQSSLVALGNTSNINLKYTIINNNAVRRCGTVENTTNQ